MKKADGFIKFIAILYILNGAFEIVSFFNNSTDYYSLIFGPGNVFLGIGIWKLKRWALYGAIILVGYSVIMSINYLLSERPDTFVTVLVIFTSLFRILVYSYLWEKRILFK